MPPDPVDRGPWVVRAGPSHRTEENRYSSAVDSGSSRPRPLIPTVPGAAQLQGPDPCPVETPSFASPSNFRPGAIFPDHLSTPSQAPVTAASSDTFPTAASPNTNHYSPSPTAPSTSPHLNIDWRNYTTYKEYIDAKGLHTYGCRTIQERLDSLRAAASPTSAYSSAPSMTGTGQQGALNTQFRQRSISNDRGAAPSSRSAAGTSPLRSTSQERLVSGSEKTITAGNWPRSVSQDALSFSTPTGVTKPRAQSCDYLGHSAVVAGGSDRAELEHRLQCRVEETRGSRQGGGLVTSPHLNKSLLGPEEDRKGSGLFTSPLPASVFTKGAVQSPCRSDGIIMRPSRLPVKNHDSHLALATNKTTDSAKDQRAAVIGNHLGYPSPLHLQLRGRADSLKIESRIEAGLAARSSSCSGPSSKPSMQRQQQSSVVLTPSSAPSAPTNGAVTQKSKVSSTNTPVRTNGGLPDGVEGADATVVVLRRDKNLEKAHVRPPSYVLAVNESQAGVVHKSPPLVKAGSADGVMFWMSNDGCREQHLKRLGDSRKKNLDDSLDSIPFIGKTAQVLLKKKVLLFSRNKAFIMT